MSRAGHDRAAPDSRAVPDNRAVPDSRAVPADGTAPSDDGNGPPVRLGIDPAACDGIGMCAVVAPRLVSVDAWGYPILVREPLRRRQARAAAAAVAACPRRALFLHRR